MTAAYSLSINLLLKSLKTSADSASKSFSKFPTAGAWNHALQHMFVLQQATFYFRSASIPDEFKQTLIDRINADEDRNTGDMICQATLGMGLVSALRTHANWV